MNVFDTATPVPPTTWKTAVTGYLVPPLLIPAAIAIVVGLFALIHGPVV
ncbi:hypothetical protein HL658_02725 [Azospirillum sp. RWY-5-1]|uniref:Uncharacterized protein n=1 Tax=Azospirillum oleiclasticum TaxID=2735135 RepID=A0ABX2T2S9_9PROT|nr:hypothetical protein [Azospirillum oleiclasticum]NYZ11450.1 hypothetical protein [Azospirillum oleiclasticum]NYZ18611.1 hypothetical protein [Azospirillum oleiclasticum]